MAPWSTLHACARTVPHCYDRHVQSPGRKRPQKRKVAEGVSPEVLDACAAQARYVGSPEHKTFPSFAGKLQARSDATKCPTYLTDPDVITGWLADAISKGNVSAAFDGDFPRYVWALPDGEDRWYEARLTNQVLGEYKGYPLNADQRPIGAA